MKPQPLPSSPLADWLKKQDSSLHGKLCELRATVTRWLTYVPATFGHYTSHTIDHSDEIVAQVGKLLFEDRKKSRLKLAPLEVYILIAAAYLHDAGMVVSEAEKEAIVCTDAWRAFTTEGGGKKRWGEIVALRNAAGDEALKHLAADRATRMLIAEHVRREHHRRAGELVRGRSLSLAQLDFEETMLRSAIADVCLAHGLDRVELEDDVRFPEARDVLGETVNLRLVSTLLRLGDLLDMRSDRACPLLMQAACPLPSDSVAHWTQYEAIEHRLTTPDKIEIRAACRSQEEHRTLHDWCTWLVREVESLPARLPLAMQKRKWQPPLAKMDGPAPSIVIKPAEGATYVPGDWRFEMDQDAIFQRLVADVYESPDVFLRELIQNALDAMRCKMYADLEAAGQELPAFPTDVPEEIRERYVLRVSLREEKVKHPETGETETVQIVGVEDCGLGMDTEIVRRYLLQVGRSYYTTADFRQTFKFHPTSRFGVGFLSVFAVSDEVTIETYKPSSPQKEGPIRLRLTGPRSYVLVEKGARKEAGTRIEVRLRQGLGTTVENLVRGWCVFAEFPIEVSKAGRCVTVREMKVEQWESEVVNPRDPEMRFARKVFPVSLPGIRGAFSFLVRRKSGQEDLIASTDLPKLGTDSLRPNARNVLAIHGIAIEKMESYRSHYVHPMLDIRRPLRVALNRDQHSTLHEEDLDRRLFGILEDYLGREDAPFDFDQWLHKIDLMDDPSFCRYPRWKERADLVPTWRAGKLVVVSINAMLAEERFFMAIPRRSPAPPEFEQAISASIPSAILLSSAVIRNISLRHREFHELLFGSTTPVGVTMPTSGEPILELTRYDAEFDPQEDPTLHLVRLPIPDLDADIADFSGYATIGWRVLNTARRFGEWYKRVSHTKTSNHGIEFSHINALHRGLCGEIWYSREPFLEILETWNGLHGSNPELVCPNVNPVIYRPKPREV